MSIGNRIRQGVVGTPGIADFTLSTALAGYAGWGDVYNIGDKFEYWAESLDTGDWEHGLGTLSGAQTLSRETPLETYVSGVYDNTNPAKASLGTNVEVYQSPSLNKDTFLTRDTVVHGSNFSTPLIARSYTITLLNGVTTTNWQAPLPSYGIAADNEFMCHVDFIAPSTGSGTVNIPAGWQQMGTLGAITLAAGDDPISCTLRSRADGTIQLYRAETGV